ncbi:MAG: hypothetical protein IJU81_03745 [Bacteroidales bacterium]|nr:hypothetical protein [Bacteroidales bacterium]
MKNIGKTLFLALLLLPWSAAVMAQGTGGQVTGNVQFDGQFTRADSVIGATQAPERWLMNARADILYTNGGFNAGLRFESYLPPLPGFNTQYKGYGIANYFVKYANDLLDVTAGTFYEQFGNGLILRAYEDRYIGIDNALLGLSFRLRPYRGIQLKGLGGVQRNYWSYGGGLVRGVDAEVDVNSLFKSLDEKPLRLSLGAGFVSRYEEAENIAAATPGYSLLLPLNVGAGSLRADVRYKGWLLAAEYARKGQDPNAMNGYIYRKGEALLLNAAYSQKGFSTSVQAKRVDNMAFKSVRSSTGEMLYINYIPAITKQHTYAFLCMYPYATQATGEMGLQADVMYKIKKETLLGGKYGTDIHFNCSMITGLVTSPIGGAGTDGYTSQFFATGEHYYTDLSLEVAKKLSSRHKAVCTYGYVVFNPTIEGHAGPQHHNHVLVADYTWRVATGKTLRFEGEWMGSDSHYDVEVDDKRAGDWLMALAEYSFGGHYFVSLSDQYCYRDGVGNYYTAAFGYTHDATRIQLSYGKQREGILCIGGVCRAVPATNGLTLGITTSF